MPKLNFTLAEVEDFLKKRKEVYGPFYETCIDKCNEWLTHADGLFPEKLIRERRPNETLEVLAYRAIIYQPKTKTTFSKVHSSLQKIRRSPQWDIRYNKTDRFSRIREEETLETYCEENFPYFTSLTNWVFSLMLRKYLTDPNAVVFVYPLEYQVEQTSFRRPFAEVYDSCNVMYFVPDDYAVLRLPNGCTYYSRNKPYKGDTYFFVTTQNIFRYDQVDGKGTYKLVLSELHGLEMLPVVKLKGVLVNQCENHFLYESRIQGMMTELNEIVREYSDLQAGKVCHLYPERWEYAQNQCSQCKGTGKRRNPLWTQGAPLTISPEITCDAPGCQHGYVVAGPYSKIMVRPLNVVEGGGVQTIPTPPAGYVQRDVEILKLQDEGVDKHEYKALAAINMEFLAQVPLSQSGVAKEVDRDELNNFVNSVAEDLVAVMDSIYKLIARYRYKDLYPIDDIEDMLPRVNVPDKFDLLSIDTVQKELTEAKTSKFNPVIVNAMEVDYASKKFNADHEVRDMVHLTLSLDPLPNISEDDKMSRLSNKGITLESYVISSNIHTFIQRAIDEDEKFPEKDLKDQKETLSKYAVELIESNDVTQELINEEVDPEDNIYGNPV
jgi:hypothetical protein